MASVALVSVWLALSPILCHVLEQPSQNQESLHLLQNNEASAPHEHFFPVDVIKVIGIIHSEHGGVCT
jgi:hypothetical protein